MHAIIVGCGRVGSTLARELDANGHDVVVIDRRSSAFRRLGETFGGRTITGVGFDRDVLESAGITADSAVMAVTNGDNSNILITRVARELFRVEKVVARIYDPKRAAIYERLGISTVATVAWASARVLQLILPAHGAVEWTDPTSSMILVERKVPTTVAGSSVEQLNANGACVVLVTRMGLARHPHQTDLVQDNDTVHVLGTTSQIEEFDRALSSTGGHS
jgi:trk system potassium uptake protein TrkA